MRQCELMRLDTKMNRSQLRPLADTDLDLVRSWRNHESIRKYMFSQHEISESEHAAWYLKVKEDPRKIVLIYLKEGKPTGLVNFTLRPGNVADWGFYLAPISPPGEGKYLGDVALHYAFDQLNLQRVCGQALQVNTASIKFHERMGFKHEGTLRQDHSDGSFVCDTLLFGMLVDEWKLKGGVA